MVFGTARSALQFCKSVPTTFPSREGCSENRAGVVFLDSFRASAALRSLQKGSNRIPLYGGVARSDGVVSRNPLSGKVRRTVQTVSPDRQVWVGANLIVPLSLPFLEGRGGRG